MSNLSDFIHVLEVMNFGPEEREDYEGRLKWLMLEASALEKRYKEGIAAGKAEGEEKKAREIAKQMIRMNRPLEEVCVVTELGLAVVQGLSREVAEEG